MKVTLLVMTDGRRECIDRAIPAVSEQIDASFAHRVIHDDSADDSYREWLTERFPGFTIIGGRERRGFAAAIQAAWAHVIEVGDDYVFHLEDDFLLRRAVSLRRMKQVLGCHPYLTQMALLRGPVNTAERRAGGVIAQHPHDYETVRWGEFSWREHRRFWTTNPSLYPTAICHRGWPGGPHSEGLFSLKLFNSDPVLRAAFWGECGEYVEHIGDTRAGTGY